MKYIRMSVVVRVEDELFGTVPDDAWEKYQNGEITDFWLYSNYFKENRSENLDYMVTEIKEIEEEGDEE
jgi:hypothetical protein